MGKKKKRERGRTRAEKAGGEIYSGAGSHRPTVHTLQLHLNELQREIQLMNAERSGHFQVRDGLLFLLPKLAEFLPDIERQLAEYYSTNHNLSGRVEINRYNIDQMSGGTE